MTRGESGNVERLYRAHAPACFAYARMLCGADPGQLATAEDVVHDVFVRVLRLPDPPPGEQARWYLLAAIRNAVANLRRDRARRDHHLRLAAKEQPMFEPPAGDADCDLGEVLLQLPDEQREAVYLKIWGGLTFSRIAELTGAPLATAASRFRYGLAKIRQLMKSVES